MFFGIPLLNVLTDNSKNFFHLSFQSRSFYINPFRSFLLRIGDANYRLASHSKSQGRSGRRLGGSL